jgi:hypothetical protein
MTGCDIGRTALDKGFRNVIVAAANDAEDLPNAKADKRFGYFLKYAHLKLTSNISRGSRPQGFDHHAPLPGAGMANAYLRPRHSD